MKVLLDTNSLIKLASDGKLRGVVVEAPKRGRVEIIVNDITREEALKKPKDGEEERILSDLVDAFSYEGSPRYFTVGESVIGGSDVIAPNFDLWEPPMDSKKAYQDSGSKRAPKDWITNKQNDARNYDHAIRLGCDYFITEENGYRRKSFPGKPAIINVARLVEILGRDKR